MVCVSGENEHAVHDLTFEEVSNINRARSGKWHASTTLPWSGADWSNAMCGEAGETANVVKKLRRIETGLQGQQDPSEPILRQALADEIADTFFYLDLLANHYGVDIPSALVRKFNSVSEREGFEERL